MPKSEQVRGFSRLNTDSTPSHLDPSEVAILENMIYDKGDRLIIREGSSVYKTNTQFGSSAFVKSAKDVDYGDGAGAFEFFAYTDGTLAYNTVSSYTDETTTFTEVDSILAATPALNTTSTANRCLEVLNRKLYITDETQNFYSVDSTKALSLVPDPTGFHFELTVGSAVAATVNAEYEDDDDTSRTFVVTETKVTTVGTTLKLRQTAGSTRPTTGGTDNLSKTSGTGDASIAYTAITYPEKFINCSIHEGRVLLISDAGRIYWSAINNGRDLTGSDTSFVDYGLHDSLSVTHATPFKRSTLITLNNNALARSSVGTMLGFRNPDSASLDTRDGLIRFQRESGSLGFLGRSAREIGNDGIGLTRNGFVTFSAVQANEEFGITDSNIISGTIQNLIKKIDWTKADQAISTVDLSNQRYMCAVPLATTTYNDTVFVYDYKNSVPPARDRNPIYKWSVFVYNLGSTEIVSMFTLRNIPFLSTSDGRIIQLNKAGTYTDEDGNYTSRLKTKSFDGGDKSINKSYDVTGHFLVGTTTSNVKAYGVSDEQSIRTNYKGSNYSTIALTPRALDISDWSDDADEIWTDSTFDVWENSLAEEISVRIGEGLMVGQEFALDIINDEGGKLWGMTGLTVVMQGDSQYGDHRP